MPTWRILHCFAASVLLLAGCGEDVGKPLEEARRLYEDGRPLEAREIALDAAKGPVEDER